MKKNKKKIDNYSKQFKLSYTFVSEKSKKDINYPKDLLQEEFSMYVGRNYKNQSDDNKSELINDLIVFKTYRVNIEQILENLNFLNNILDKVLLLLSVISAVIVSKNLVTLDFLKEARKILDNLIKAGKDTKAVENRIQYLLSYYDKWSIILSRIIRFTFFICVFSIFSFFFFRIHKKSFVRRLICVNNTIYKLEAIKEKKTDENKNFSVNSCNSNEELKDSSSVKVNADDKNSSEIEKNKNKKNKNKNKNKKR